MTARDGSVAPAEIVTFLELAHGARQQVLPRVEFPRAALAYGRRTDASVEQLKADAEQVTAKSDALAEQAPARPASSPGPVRRPSPIVS